MNFLNRVMLRRAAPEEEEEIALDPRRLERIRRNPDLRTYDEEEEFDGPPPRPVVMVRRTAEETPPFDEWRCWLGGLPKLGENAWPRGTDGRPLRFAAQVDLAELTAHCPETPLPKMGSLAFFLGSGAVVFTPVGTAPVEMAPGDLPPAFEEGGLPEPERFTMLQQPVFPCYPMRLMGLNLPEEERAYDEPDRHEEIARAQEALLHDRVAPRSTPFSIAAAREAGIESADTLWWHAAMFVRDQILQSIDDVSHLVQMRIGWISEAEHTIHDLQEDKADEADIAAVRADLTRWEAEIPQMRELGRQFFDFSSQFDSYIGRHDAWEVMDDEAQADLVEALEQVHEDYRMIARKGIPHDLDALREICIRRMLAGDDKAYEALPQDMRIYVEESCRLAPDAQHQVFGLGVSRGGASQEAEAEDTPESISGDVLLLQIGWDDLAEMRYGNRGVWQFRMSLADAVAGRWEKVRLTFSDDDQPIASFVEAELSGKVAAA